jgi:hypothetical protein
MPITVFDAVGKFSADSRNLDDFITKLDRALPDASQKSAVATKALKDAQDNLKASLKALREEGGNTADNWQKVADAQRQVAITSEASKRSQNELKASIGGVKESSREAKAELGLLGEGIGIHLPRHVRSLLAELPGLTSALNAAFGATAVIFLVDALSQIPEKILSITADLAGWTKEAQAAYESQRKLNQSLLDLAETRQDAAVREKERGLEGARLTQQQITDNKTIIENYRQRIVATGDQIGKLQQEKLAHDEVANGWGAETFAESAYITNHKAKSAELQKSIDELSERQRKLTKDRDELEQGSADKASQLTHQQLSEYIALESAKVEAKRKASQEQLALDLATWQAEYQNGIITYAELLELEGKSEEDKYQVDQKALQDKLDLQKLDPTKNLVAIATLNGQIEAAEKQHEAKLLSDYAKYQEQYKKLTSEKPQSVQFTGGLPKISNEISTVEFSNTEGATKKINDMLNVIRQLEDAFHELSVTSSQDLAQQAAKMELDFEKIKKSGTATKRDLILAEAAYVEALIESEKAAGHSTGEAEARLARIEKEASRLGVVLQKLGRDGQKHLSPLGQIFDQVARHAISAGAAVKAVANIFLEAIGSSVAAALTGSESFGQAMERMLKSVLASLAGEAVVQTIREIAAGLAAAARYDYVSAGLHYSSAKVWGAVAIASAVGAAAIPSGGSGGSSDAGAPAGTKPIETSGATQTEAQPVQTTNVQRFARGGLVSGPTMAIIGDAVNSTNTAVEKTLSGPGQREAAIPIDDDRATSAIAAALVKHMPPTNIKINVKGKSLKHLIRDISHEVESGNVTLKASHAGAVRKQS